MTTTDLTFGEVVAEQERAVTLFPGATPQDLIAAATEVADAFSNIVKHQRLYQRIGGRDHVLIEGWQTVGTLVGVFAVRDAGVKQLPWPKIAPLGEQPPDPGREPQRSSAAWPQWDEARTALARWAHHRDLLTAKAEGLAYGFTASFTAQKDGRAIGWGEGRCDRSEAKWTNRDDYAMQSMAQTRGQSRTLAAPLRFIVKLAGYELDNDGDTDRQDSGEGLARVSDLEGQLAEAQAQLSALLERAGAVLDLRGQQEVVAELESAWPGVDAVKFLNKLEKRFGGYVPESAGDTLRAWAWFATRPATQEQEAPQNGSQSATDGQTPPEPTEPTSEGEIS
jgi:hypothetical protein